MVRLHSLQLQQLLTPVTITILAILRKNKTYLKRINKILKYF